MCKEGKQKKSHERERVSYGLFCASWDEIFINSTRENEVEVELRESVCNVAQAETEAGRLTWAGRGPGVSGVKL